MLKKLLVPIGAVALFVIVVGILTQGSSSFNLSKYLSLPTPVPSKIVTIDGKSLNVEIANSQDSRTKGLSGRSSIAVNGGMLFVFDSKQTSPTFWMKDMTFPLDIIWISNAKIVKIDRNLPSPTPGTDDSSLTKYTSTQAVDYVLEVSAGFADTNSVKVGDSVTLPTL